MALTSKAVSLSSEPSAGGKRQDDSEMRAHGPARKQSTGGHVQLFVHANTYVRTFFS